MSHSKSPTKSSPNDSSRKPGSIAALNHPNICHLYDVGPNYLVMELVDGEPLLSTKKPGPLPFGKAVEYVGQILDADVETRAKANKRRRRRSPVRSDWSPRALFNKLLVDRDRDSVARAPEVHQPDRNRTPGWHAVWKLKIHLKVTGITGSVAEEVDFR